MTLALADRVQESSTTTGTGTLTLAGAITGYRTFASVFANGSTVPYCIFMAANGTWEVGQGTLVTPTTLSRDTVQASSNGNALVNFIAGSKYVFITIPASLVNLLGILPTSGGAGQYLKQATAGAAISVGTIPAGDVPNLAASIITSGQLALARGGTGVDLSASGSATALLAQDASHVISARNLVAADIPNLDASKITTGLLALSRGGTGVDLSASGSTTAILAQDASHVISARSLVAGDIPSLAASIITSGQLALARGGTSADLSATGGANQFLKQSGSGAAITVGTIASADIATALTTPGAIGGTTPGTGKFTTVATPVLGPTADSTTALQITKADLSTSILTIDSSNSRLGIGVTPATILDIAQASGPTIQATTAGTGVLLIGRRSEGTLASPTAATNNDNSLKIIGQGYGTTGFVEEASIYIQAEGTLTDTDGRGRIIFNTTPANSVAFAERMRIDSAGNVGINTTYLNVTSLTATRLHVAETITTSPRGIMSSQHNDGTDGARLHLRKSRGVLATPTVVVSGDNLGRVVASGYDGSSYLEMAGILLGTEGTIASTRIPTNIQFFTATNAAPSVLTERMRIDSAGKLSVTGPIIPYADSTTALQINNAGNSSTVLTVDTTNLRLGVGLTPGFKLDASDAATDPAGAVSAGNFLYITTLTTNNAQQTRGVSSDCRINAAGFNNTNHVAAFLGTVRSTGVSGAGSVTAITGVLINPINSGAGTVGTIYGFRMLNPTNSGGGTINNVVGYYAPDVTPGTNNYGFQGDVSSGSNKYNLYMSGTAQNYLNGNTGVGTASPNTVLHALASDSATATVTNVLTVDHTSSGTPAASYGTGVIIQGKDSTTTAQSMARLRSLWTVATHASRTARGVLSAFDTAERDCIAWEASGTAAMVGFLGAAPVVQQTQGATLTNNITAGGSANTLANFTSLTTYSTDAAAIRNNEYQLGQTLKTVVDALRLFGLLT